MTHVFLSLGSNLGNRLDNLESAVRALRVSDLISLVATSRVYETEPVEAGSGHPEYLNCVVQVECSMPPVELLRYCQGIEAALGRDKKGQMAPRTVDIDILLYGEDEVDLPDLQIPHRGIKRAFNIRCLADIDAGIVVPEIGNVEEMLAGAETSGVKEFREQLP